MKEKIKILYMIHSLKKGGPVNMLYNLVKFLDKRKFDITLLALEVCSEKNKKDFSDVECKIIELKKSNILSILKQVKELLEKILPDIVHSHGGIADIINSKVDGLHKTFSTVHCVPHEDFVMKDGEFIGSVKALIYNYFMKKLDYPIACSETVAKKIEYKTNYKIDYIRNGIDFKNNNIQTKIFFREYHGIDKDKTIFVFCGYLSKRKNVSLILEAFKVIQRTDIVFLILGDGPEYEQLKRDAQIDNRVIMIGRVSNAFEYLPYCDYFISASLSEGLPLAVLEGMSCGLPAILSDIDSHREVANLSEDSVILFKNNDCDSLVKCISEINKNDYDKKSNAASTLISQVLNSRIMAGEYEKRYINIKI
ncbi:putative glycosyltransferase EpsF [Oxobacter pfennigii]|uniref:Putative glycosyltransferase EpsF n=1 Tax=Oxobacter pfennigii TaxID=36849 RepID=A0A0P8W534_9CLOT|nr:glycosyltransferase [Oxobacter pfennigii]KPU43714.1 putative glycosyltransferase EpsF [Oxobacter pfennigii]